MKRKFNAAHVPGFIPLETVSIASPCHADWDAMQGDDRARFCPSCAKNVYNLSAMTGDEAQLLLQEKAGKLCVRFFQREDGTMLTQDCPVGAAALKQRSPAFVLWAGVASLALIAAALVSPSFLSSAHAQPEPTSGEVPTQTSTPTPEAPISQSPILATLGEVRLAPRPTAAPTPEATPTPTPILRQLMGKPSIPHSTPTPAPITIPTPSPGLPHVMGRIRSMPPVKIQPIPAPQRRVALMGAIAVPRSSPPPSIPPKKRTSQSARGR